MKKRCFLCLIILLCFVFCSCSLSQNSNVPYNNEISFYEITACLPGDYIRDSTQSTDNTLIYEKGFYKKYIILTRNDITDEIDASLDAYAVSMRNRGADSERGTFLYCEAVKSTYIKDDMFCQEIFFAYNGSFYAMALRGGTEEEFQDLLNGLNTPETLASQSESEL